MTDPDPGVVAEVTQAAQAAIVERDWDSLRLLLHPYMHWTTADGTRVRGRVKVMELLRTEPPSVLPITVELRDGQIYRWQERP